jgi:hypothetical protein
MATSIDYNFEYPYRPMGPDGLHFPVLQVGLENPNDSERQVDTFVYVDSGSRITVLDGEIAQDIGINFTEGEEQQLGSIAGGSIQGWLNNINLHLEGFPPVLLRVAFVDPSFKIRRQLLGRDFFYHVQIGFWEYARLLYLSPNSIPPSLFSPSSN